MTRQFDASKYDSNRRPFEYYDREKLKAEFPMWVSDVYLKHQKLRGVSGQMQINHRYAMWTVVKWLNPDIIIESGVFWGWGTKFLRAAAPNARILAIDPIELRGRTEKPESWVDPSPLTTYFLGEDFQDLDHLDISEYLKYKIPKRTTEENSLPIVLAVLDDHDSILRRASSLLLRHNVTRILFDDNYHRFEASITPEILMAGADVQATIAADISKMLPVWDPFQSETDRQFKIAPLELFAWSHFWRDVLVKEYFVFPPVLANQGVRISPDVNLALSEAFWTPVEFEKLREAFPDSVGVLPDKELKQQASYRRIAYVELNPVL